MPLDEHAAIAADAPCIHCRYNLRGLDPQTKCPECGTPVLKSISAPLLRCEDPDWLRSISFGFTLVAVATVGAPVLFGLAALAAFDGAGLLGLGLPCLTLIGGIGV